MAEIYRKDRLTDIVIEATSRSLKSNFGSRLGLYHLESHHAKFQSISMKNGRVINILEFVWWVWVVVGGG